MDTSGLVRLRVPLRVQGRNSVRVIWTLAEAADWAGETWDPDVREHLRRIIDSLRHTLELTGGGAVPESPSERV